MESKKLLNPSLMENKDGNSNVKSGLEGAKSSTNRQEPELEQQEQNPNRNDTNDNCLTTETEEREEDEEEEDYDDGDDRQHEAPPTQSSRRTPFTNLSQVDADLALARTLQEQERAYMMLRMNAEGSDYGSWEAGSYLHDEEDDFDDLHDIHNVDEVEDDDEEDNEEHGHEYGETDAEDDIDAFDVHAHSSVGEENNPRVEFDPAVFSSDEAYARALQDAEDRDMAARLLALAGLSDRVVEIDYHGSNSQDAWEDVDPDELSYEELLALGDAVGTESRGLSVETIASLPSINYKAGSSQSGSNDSCVICRLDYEDDENLTLLSCKHTYHPECINNWLKINKVCPVCSTEVSTSGQSTS